MRGLFSYVRLGVLSVVGGLALLEIVLRVFGYSYSPLALQPPENTSDFRPFHGASLDPRVSKTEPVTVFDPELLWAPNPRIGPVLAADGTRGGPLARPSPAPDEVLVVAVGDSNTMGPLELPDHWPGYLQELVGLNAPTPPWRVVNAGVYGYSSFQGVVRTRQVLPFAPRIVYISFGANDAHPIQRTDAEYALRARPLARWQWLRLAPPLMHAYWRARDANQGPRPASHRVPLADYRANLREMVRLCQARGARPILLTRPYRGQSSDPARWMTYAPEYNQATRDVAASEGVLLVDVYEAFRAEPGAFVDESHFTRHGYQAMARLLVRHLREAGLIASDYVYRTALDLGAAPETESGLGDGWYARERWPRSPGGRWTAREAVLHLERRSGERGLAVDLDLYGLQDRTRGAIEVNGRPLLQLDGPNGRMQRMLDLGALPDREITVRFRTDEPTPARPSDPRELGVFVHSVALRPNLLASDVNPGLIEDGRPELAAGFWRREKWADERRGRWTAEEAAIRLSRVPGENRLVVELSLESPRGTTEGTLDVGGRTRATFHAPNGPRTEILDVADQTGDEIVLRIRVRKPFVPHQLDPRSTDDRTLGVFVHEVRLERNAELDR